MSRTLRITLRGKKTESLPSNPSLPWWCCIADLPVKRIPPHCYLCIAVRSLWRGQVGSVRSDIDAQRKRIRVQEEEGFITIDGTCISWGAADIAPGGVPASALSFCHCG